jgi:hypothetical protein
MLGLRSNLTLCGLWLWFWLCGAAAAAGEEELLPGSLLPAVASTPAASTAPDVVMLSPPAGVSAVALGPWRVLGTAIGSCQHVLPAQS